MKATTITARIKNYRTLHILLWIAQIILAIIFLMVGFMKVATPIDELSKIMPLAGEMPGLIRFIGLSEVLGGFGLILPTALRIKPHLTIWSAGSLAVVMVLAVGFHISRGENFAIGTILGILAVFITWGRLKKAIIAENGKKDSTKLQGTLTDAKGKF